MLSHLGKSREVRIALKPMNSNPSPLLTEPVAGPYPCSSAADTCGAAIVIGPMESRRP